MKPYPDFKDMAFYIMKYPEGYTYGNIKMIAKALQVS
jgi:hypothetical protein